jgi:hypothetical protein
MYHFEDLVDQPLSVAFIDEVAGKERWRTRTGTVVSTTNGYAFLLPTHTPPAFQLLPEWEERIRLVTEGMPDQFEAAHAIYVLVGSLPDDANLDDYSPTGINLNS